MILRIETYLRTVIDGRMQEFLSMGKPCDMPQGPNGFQSVAEMRKELRARNAGSHTVTEVENGLEIRPLPDTGHVYSRQVITLIPSP